MKKRIGILVFVICLFTVFFVSADAVIQISPKRDKIELSIERTDMAPVIDAIINDGEYAKLDIKEEMMSYIVGEDSDLNRVRKMKFGAYAAVCGDTLYFALEHELDPAYKISECSAKNMWAQSCLLMSFAKSGSTGRTALELGIREGEDHVWRYAEGKDAPDYEYAVKYENGKFTYEFAIAVSSFCDENDESFMFCFSISAGDYFDNGRYAYVQLGKGISGFSTAENADAGKDASLFPTFKITDIPETEPVYTETETEPETEPEIPYSGSGSFLPVAACGAVLCVILAVSGIKFGKKYKDNNYSY